MMILCMNLNAAVDKTVIVDSFQLGEIHRPEMVKVSPGGKGCNVARALKQLGEAPVVSGWVGGPAGQFIEEGLHKEGICTNFIHTHAESRTCLSILDTKSRLVTEIYERGEPISASQVDQMREHFRSIIDQFDAVTFSGSLPTGVPSDFYSSLITIAHEAGVLTLLDTSDAALLHGVQARPFLIKPNEAESTMLAGRKLDTLSAFAAAAADIATYYRTTVVLTLGANGAMAADGQNVLHVKSPRVAVKSAVGSGDSMLAGLAYGLTNHLTWEQVLMHGIAAGTANTLQVGAGHFAMADLERVRRQIIIDPVIAPENDLNLNP